MCLFPHCPLSEPALQGLCVGCCRAHSACSAPRRKWRVLVPILHLWSSLGKEAPLHLLLFAVADITSFPGQSVRVSCHSVKILLCYWEGFAEGKEGGRGQERVRGGREGEVCVNQTSLFVNEGPCRRMIFSCPEDILFWAGLRTLCLRLSAYAKLKVNRSLPYWSSPFSKQTDFTFFI